MGGYNQYAPVPCGMAVLHRNVSGTICALRRKPYPKAKDTTRFRYVILEPGKAGAFTKGAKMKRVRKTQNTSHGQIQNMVHNLRVKFSPHANIQTTTRVGTKFWISNGAGFYGWLDTWSDLQVVYSELIRRKV